MASNIIVVKAALDAEAGVWFVESSDLPGLRAEGASIEDLLEKLPAMVADLFEESGQSGDRHDLPIELIAHASTRVRVGRAA
jgi:predicted RNase H-like HicB family nuclease